MEHFHEWNFAQLLDKQTLRERSSIPSALGRGVAGLTENTDVADASRGVSGQN